MKAIVEDIVEIKVVMPLPEWLSHQRRDRKCIFLASFYYLHQIIDYAWTVLEYICHLSCLLRDEYEQ